MNERVRFIAAHLAGDDSISTLCREYGISRKTGHKWIDRYEEGGASALEDRSRRPLHHPQAIPSTTVEALVGLRRAHPSWGPRKLLVVLHRTHPELALPVASTVTEMLRKEGLLTKRRRRRRSTAHVGALAGFAAPNETWCADFKGHFEVAGRRCHPLTITDGFSRYLLACHALAQPRGTPARRVFEAAFVEYGLPDVIRTDNGPPFASLALGGLSSLAIWWLRLGIRPERIAPGRPDQNGRHERMHRTLKAEATRPASASFRAQQRRFDSFRTEYNDERPHEAIGQRTPGSLYAASTRPFPRRLPEPEYPRGFLVEQVYDSGCIRLDGVTWYLSPCLAGELVGVENVGDGRWAVHFGPLALGILDRAQTQRRGYQCRGRALPFDGRPPRRRRRRPRV
jgi:putative transposase